MKIKVIVKLALKHLKNKKMRSIITIGGMAIGVGVIVFLLSFGFGLQKVVTDQLVSLKSINTIEVTSQKSKVLKLDKNTINELKRFKGVKDVVGLYNSAGKMSYGGSTTDVVVYGASPTYLDLSDVKTTEGKIFGAERKKSDVEEALVNLSALEIIGIKDRSEAIGKEIELSFVSNVSEEKTGQEVNEETGKNTKSSPSNPVKKFKISGVVDDSSGPFAYVHEDVLEEAGLNTYSQVRVLADNRNEITEIRAKIENKGFTAESPVDTLDEINQLFRILRAFLAGIGGIGLLIAALGMFNTITVSLLERTKEIGLMKTLGAKRKDVLRIFLAEAVVMSVAGGLAGVLIAFIIGSAINLWLTILANQRGAEVVHLFYIPVSFAIFILAFVAAIGVGTAIFPARRASGINPIQALKHE